jgi:asparagine synthase (glutamine-hydrolysing)
MCGITGLVFRDPRRHAPADLLRAMADTIRHRGPDDAGVYTDGAVGLAHRRLSILDLSPAGHQPMANEDGTVWIAFNGEVYNFRALRRELEGRHTFRSNTDTEVLIHLYEDLGPAMVDRLDGMFAFAIWDARKRRVVLARDPFGIKPLYVAFDDERLVFGSELKPLLASQTVRREIDREALNDFFDLSWIPAPRTIWRGVTKLPPAHVWELDLDTWRTTSRRYWRPEYRPGGDRTLDAWADEVSDTLDRSVRDQMVADVPLGAFLSGGIDSSLVTLAASRATAGEHLKTFTIAFGEKDFSERPYAEQVARTLGVDATFRDIAPAAIDDLPMLAEWYDEPFADSSMLPTYAVCKATRERVTVALSGDGGDELFTGYRHHLFAERVSRLDRVPTFLTRAVFGALARHSPADSRARDWSERLAFDPDWRRFSILRLPGRERRLAVLAPAWRQRRDERLALIDPVVRSCAGVPPVTQSQLFDMEFYLPNDMLVKVDRASMAHALEVRVPFLSRTVADLALRIPEGVRFTPGREKRVLRTLVERRFGPELAWRTKQGFGVPLQAWMRAAATVDRERSLLDAEPVRQGILDAGAVSALFASVRGPGDRWHVDRADELFGLFCFDAWWRRHAA